MMLARGVHGNSRSCAIVKLRRRLYYQAWAAYKKQNLSLHHREYSKAKMLLCVHKGTPSKCVMEDLKLPKLRPKLS